MFKNYFNFEVPNALAKQDKNKNDKFVEEIKKRWINLKYDVEKMFEDKKKLNNQIKYWKLLKKFLILIKRYENNEV